MPFRPERVISGGQTGADQGALVAARELGIPTGGTAPKGWRTEAGPAPWLADYGLVEDRESGFGGYTERTWQNIRGSDATVIFGSLTSPGSRLTNDLCTQAGKPYMANPTPAGVRELCERHGVKTLNVAGNRESVNPGIGERVRAVLVEAFGDSAA